MLLLKIRNQSSFCDPSDVENFAHAITDKTKAVYAETIGNPN